MLNIDKVLSKRCLPRRSFNTFLECKTWFHFIQWLTHIFIIFLQYPINNVVKTFKCLERTSNLHLAVPCSKEQRAQGRYRFNWYLVDVGPKPFYVVYVFIDTDFKPDHESVSLNSNWNSVVHSYRCTCIAGNTIAMNIRTCPHDILIVPWAISVAIALMSTKRIFHWIWAMTETSLVKLTAEPLWVYLFTCYQNIYVRYKQTIFTLEEQSTVGC